MRGKHVLIGVLGYLGGAAALLILVMIATGGVGLVRLVDGADLMVLLAGAAAVVIAALALGHLEYTRPSPGARGEGARPKEKTWLSQESVTWSSLTAVAGGALAFAVSAPASAEEDPVYPARGSFEELVIDGDRDGVAVALDHDHANDSILGALEMANPCGRCHHLNYPGEEATPCSECHRGRVEGVRTDIFDHDRHADFLARVAGGDDQGCRSCHPISDIDEPRTRENVTACVECHAPSRSAAGAPGVAPMVPPGVEVEMGEGENQGMARSYVEALHGQCIGCHETVPDQTRREELTRCVNCHPAGGVRTTAR